MDSTLNLTLPLFASGSNAASCSILKISLTFQSGTPGEPTSSKPMRLSNNHVSMPWRFYVKKMVVTHFVFVSMPITFVTR